MDVAELINKYGFPIVAAGGMGYLIYYVWEWATKEIKPVLSEANVTLIALIDRKKYPKDSANFEKKLKYIKRERERENLNCTDFSYSF
jgi:hypothetical protein